MKHAVKKSHIYISFFFLQVIKYEFSASKNQENGSSFPSKR